MISNGEGQNYFAVKKSSALLRGITSKHIGDFYFFNCLHPFRTKTVSENKDFCGDIMPSEYTKIMEFNQYQKCEKTPSIIYGDLESLIKRTDGCKISKKNIHKKVGECIPSGYSMSKIWTFNDTQNVHGLHRDED